MADLNSSLKLPLREIMSKSAIDETSLPNSVLNRQQADRFIDLVIDTSILLKNIRIQRVSRQKGSINKLDLGGIVTQGAMATSRTTTRVPSESIITWDTEKYRSAFDLKSDFLEDNIEQAGVRDTLLSMFTKRISIDTELAAIQGDNSLSIGDSQSDANNLLGVNDGLGKILLNAVPAAQIIDAGGKAPSKKLYYQMKRAVPARYRVAKPDYVWIVPSGPADKWGQRGSLVA